MLTDKHLVSEFSNLHTHWLLDSVMFNSWVNELSEINCKYNYLLI